MVGIEETEVIPERQPHEKTQYIQRINSYDGEAGLWL